MVKSLKIIPKRETCSSILRRQSNTKQHAFFCKSCKLLKKWKIAVFLTVFRGNDFEASFLSGADHAFAGL